MGAKGKEGSIVASDVTVPSSLGPLALASMLFIVSTLVIFVGTLIAYTGTVSPRIALATAGVITREQAVIAGLSSVVTFVFHKRRAFCTEFATCIYLLLFVVMQVPLVILKLAIS